MSLNIYLFFNGQCNAAFDFYRRVFGGEVIMKSTFADAPADMGVSDDDKDKIMHISMRIGDNVLMGSDMLGDSAVEQAGGSFAISYSPASKTEADELFAKLTAGGTVSMAMQDTFWGSYYGMGKDKFGVTWMLNVDLGSA